MGVFDEYIAFERDLARDTPNRLTPRERYQRDVEFRSLVDLFEHFIHQARYTPTEIREAALLAAVNVELRRPPGPFFMEGRTYMPKDMDAGG